MFGFNNVDLVLDRVQLAEIDLLTDVIIAVRERGRQLSQEEIDSVLAVNRELAGRELAVASLASPPGFRTSLALATTG